MFCDTDQIGTRNYICKVETSVGGIAYSSVVPVTVTEKQIVETAPQEPPVNTPETTGPPQQEMPEDNPQAPETEETDSVTEPSSPTTEKEPETTGHTHESSNAVTEPVQETEQDIPEPSETEETNDKQEEGLPWWSLVIIGLAGIGAGIGTAIILIRKNQK